MTNVAGCHSVSNLDQRKPSGVGAAMFTLVSDSQFRHWPRAHNLTVDLLDQLYSALYVLMIALNSISFALRNEIVKSWCVGSCSRT